MKNRYHYTKKNVEKRRALGLCIGCGKEKGAVKQSYCNECKIKRNKRIERQVSSGFCITCKIRPIKEGCKCLCVECMKIKAEYNKIRKNRLKINNTIPQ